ncbi:MAG: amino acid adenylation domain-containing protein [Kiloniellaceae bacterium]
MNDAGVNAGDTTLRDLTCKESLTARDFPRDATLHKLISAQAELTPEATALVFEGRQLTYGELERRSNQLAHRLRGLEVEANQPVALVVERSLDMVVGLLGIMKAGGAYIPVDPSYPADRVAYMLEDSGTKVILTEASLVARLPASTAQVLCLDRDWPEIAKQPDDAPSAIAGAGDRAYIIYTSGSTGRPKGVEIPHRALVNFMCSLRDQPGLRPEDRLLAVTTLSFDIAGLELYLPLVVGATVVLASRSLAGDGRLLAEALEKDAITVMQATPATWRLLLQAGWSGKPDLRILCGGETLPRELAEQLLPRCAQLWNLYGPTEATIWSTLHLVESGSGPVSIGRPIANTEIQILDETLRPVAPGEAGELFIGGEGLARGYFKRPELTAERFLDHPLEASNDRRLYRTGDLAKYRPDGMLEHLGRVDFQVKVRGFRIELGEIEATLEQQPEVSQAVVLAREDRPGDKQLVAYVTTMADAKPTSRALREALSARLPDYMVPGLFVFLDAFPLTPNGKVDRNALPAPAAGRAALTEPYVAPRNEGEERLAALWSDVLRVEKIGVEDNFFELGGDSLKVAQVATRIRETFQVDMPLRLMFEHPTVSELLPVIEALPPVAEGLEELPITSVQRGEVIPLSFAQERVWFIHQLNPDNLAYNFQSSIRFRGELDFAALQDALGEILRRHEGYRSTYPMVDGVPQQVVHPAKPFSLMVVDFSVQPESRRDAAVKAWCDELFQKRFDLEQLPLVQWTLLRLSADEHLLIHMEHHLVHDGWSFNVFFRELVDLYRAFAAGQPSPLPELPIQFAEFAAWQHQWMQGAVSDHQLAYWKKRFATIPPVMDLPIRGPRPASQTFKGTSLRPEIPLALCNDLRALSRREGSTLFMTMLAGFMALLHRYSGETDLAVGTFFANRRQQASECLIGMILNNVVIRASLDANPTVHDFIAQVRDVVLEGANFQDVPFDRVVDAVQPKRDMSYNPLFQVMFSFHDEPMPEEGLPGLDVKLTPVLSNGSSKFDLGVIGIPHSAQNLGLPQGSDQDGLTMIWEHNTDLFDTATIARMVEHYKILLAAMVADPGQRISNLPLASAEERQQLLVDWNATGKEVATGTCLHDLIGAQAARSPDAVAVVFEDQSMTYAELERRANQLAHHLRGLGVGPGRLVGLCLERSPAMLVGLLGIMKAGGAYVPIDPTFPRDRQAFMLEDAKIGLVVSEGDLCRDLLGEAVTLVRLDRDSAVWGGQPETPPKGVDLGPEDLAYVIYTSGSTGLPKGVRLPHRALVNFMTTMAEKPGLKAEDRLLAVTTLSFDIAGLELYLPLTVGARVVIASRAIATNGELLAERLRESGTTIMQATPTTWQMLIDSGWSGDSKLTALCGGEALPRALAEELLPRVKQLWNMYGPTETTIWSTIHPVESGEGAVPIGRPIANTRIYLLDAFDNLVPAGVIGELCIGGQGVALGYLDRPELTAERFIDNPVAGAPPGVIYRTGDLARYLADGTLVCLGRTDQQVKMRGFRIELGEIETLLEAQETVRQAVVILREDVAGDQRLVAYLVLAGNGGEASVDSILARLRDRLPDYMVPSMAVVLDSLPLTPNGKIDRKALPAPQGMRQQDADSYIAPRNEQERALQAIWQEVIGVEPLGMRDDFFQVGGHSLLAVRLVAAIEKRMGQRITLAALLQGRTIEAVARMLGATQLPAAAMQAPTGEESFLVLQSGGKRTPFFAGGSHPRYRELARRLGSDQPVYQLDIYALQSQRISQGLKPYERIEDMAACYVRQLQAVQPKGPYVLGGGCEGAYVAFEAALQLQKQGQQVDRLVMWIPPAMREAPGFVLGRTLPFRVFKQLHQFVSAGAYSNLRRETLRLQLRHEYIDFKIFRAIDRYRPGSTFKGEVTIVRTEFSPPNSADLNKQWFECTTEGGSVHIMPGHHGTWLDDDHIANFSNLLKKTLHG